MIEAVPTSVHFDLTQRQVCGVQGLVEVDIHSFHSPAMDSLSQAVGDIVDDGTPEGERIDPIFFISATKISLPFRENRG